MDLDDAVRAGGQRRHRASHVDAAGRDRRSLPAVVRTIAGTARARKPRPRTPAGWRALRARRTRRGAQLLVSSRVQTEHGRRRESGTGRARAGGSAVPRLLLQRPLSLSGRELRLSGPPEDGDYARIWGSIAFESFGSRWLP